MQHKSTPTYTSTTIELPEIMSTEQAAAALNRSPKTLRKWSCLGIGGIHPVRINGRLGWYTKDVLALIANLKSKG